MLSMMLGLMSGGLDGFRQTPLASPSEGHDLDLQTKVGVFLGGSGDAPWVAQYKTSEVQSSV